jgi:hypothetical protein
MMSASLTPILTPSIRGDWARIKFRGAALAIILDFHYYSSVIY